MNLNAQASEITAAAGVADRGSTDSVRRQIRYPLHAPASFTWFNEEGKQRGAKGISRNLGEGGAYVCTKHCPPVGAHMILIFRFLRMPAFARYQRLEMSGQVVRTEVLADGKGSWGFAVASTWAILQDSEEGS
jgi:hypothetical protein